MRVALLGPMPEVPGRPVGGVQSAIEILTRSILDRGVDVVVIDAFTGYKATRSDFEVLRLPVLPTWRMGLLSVPSELRRAVTTAKANLLHVHLGMQFCKLHESSVATVHGLPHLESPLRHPNLRGTLAAAVLRRSFVKGLGSAQQVISISDEVARVASQVGVPSVRIPNPVAPAFFDVERVAGTDFVAVGDIIRGKNQRLLIEAFVEFVGAGGLGNLLIIGNVGDQAYLDECRSAAKPAAKRIQFLGAKAREEVAWFLAHARASVSASLRETSSIAIAEALAANCPVLTLDVGTAREQVGLGEGAGIVLPVRSNPGDVTEALLALAKWPADAGPLRRRVATQHPDDVARRTIEVYRSVLEPEFGHPARIRRLPGL